MELIGSFGATAGQFIPKATLEVMPRLDVRRIQTHETLDEIPTGMVQNISVSFLKERMAGCVKTRPTSGFSRER